MCGRYKISKPVSKTVDLVKTNIKVEDTDKHLGVTHKVILNGDLK